MSKVDCCNWRGCEAGLCGRVISRSLGCGEFRVDADACGCRIVADRDSFCRAGSAAISPAICVLFDAGSGVFVDMAGVRRSPGLPTQGRSGQSLRLVSLGMSPTWDLYTSGCQSMTSRAIEGGRSENRRFPSGSPFSMTLQSVVGAGCSWKIYGIEEPKRSDVNPITPPLAGSRRQVLRGVNLKGERRRRLLSLACKCGSGSRRCPVIDPYS
jgi:hypothetical protein